MKHEFKKITKGSETRYVLDEFATGGSSSSASVGSLPGVLGGVRKRGDNLLAQEAGDKKEAPKPRNFVAKNAKMGGAGAHKDKKKAQKQGQEKHRKPYMEELKNRIETLKSHLEENDLAQQMMRQHDAEIQQSEKSQGVVEGAEFGAYYSEQVAQQVFDANPNISDENEVLDAAWPIVVKDLGKKAARYQFNYDEDFPSDVVTNYFWLKKQNQSVAEGDNAEYDDEAGMADNNLETLKRAVQGLDDIIDAGDNLPEWCQEKIAVAKSMLVAVWDYMQSEEQDMSEEFGHNSLDADSARKIMRELDRGVPMHELFMEYPELSRMYDNIAGEMGLHGDDDNEKIERILYDELDDLAHSDRYTEAAPKGWEGTVKAMKKHNDIDNPWALAHWMKNKGYKSHKKEDAYMEELTDKLAEKLLPSMDLDTWKADFKAADPNKYHQFKNKTDDKKDQMATAALYKARQPKSK